MQIEKTATLRVQVDKNGNKFIAGIHIGDETDDQCLISELEERVTALEDALAGTQAQVVLKQAIIDNASMENSNILQLATQIVNRSLENDRLLSQTKKKPVI